MNRKLRSIHTKALESPQSVRFNELKQLCEYYFGPPRHKSTSHCIFKTPWLGDPRVNIQNRNGMAKAYQVKQALKAIGKLEQQNDNGN